ncbi:dynamin family protein [Purpureocillium lilacinum]|uniref:Dynamin family protein n=1 Tax=Purpureocillium lilacinum TaxID=33203 RepID=A0A179GGZ8_PURLI|nr:dynamin family protein [Purpureocillium lilacinum]
MPGRSSHSDESDDQTQGPDGAPQILSFLYQRDGLDRVFGHRFPQGLRPFPEGLSNSLEDVSANAAPQHDPSPSSSSDTTRVGRESSASTAKDARNTLGAEMNIPSSGNGPGIADDPDSSTIPSSSIGPLLAYPTTVGAEQTGSPPEVNNGPVSISKVEARDGRVSADSPGSTGDETRNHIPVGTNAGAIDTSEPGFDISIAAGLGYNPEDAEFDFGQMDGQAPIANGNAEAIAESHRPALSGDHSSAMSRLKDPVELEEHRYNEMDCQTGCLAQPIMQTVPALRGLTLETRMAIWECFYAVPRAHGIVCFFCGQCPLGWTTWIRGSAYYYAEPKDLRKMIQSAQEETFRVDHDIDAESRWVAHKKRPILLHMPPAYREAPPEAKALHEITHKLSSCGVGKIVNLPQIIVVGEQSAGKSSVLEAISRVRFPVHNDICTRFATELVLRQARQTRVDVSVRFDDKSKAPKAFQKTGFNEDDLPGIIKEAKACMGIAATGKDFSRDVLRLEIEGPNMYPLTLVDLPGIFHVSTDQQSEPGRETVNRIVESYMKKKNSIILVVIPASNQLANNYALKVVMQVDPKRKRTLGVITKPDCTRPGSSDERKYIQLAKNQETTHKLKLGWHVLRNRSEDEENLDDRDALEESFFEETAWRSLYAEDRGIVSLRKKLSKVLYKHIRENIHGVIDDIEGKLRERQTELGRLGRPRSKPEEMRSFLLTIAGEFQRLARDGIHGQYSDRFFGDLDTTENKFRALLRNFNRAFDYVLATKGSTLTISPPDGAELPPTKAPAFLTEFLEAYPYEFPDPTPISRQVLNEQLQRQAASNQGREFPGLPNRELVTQLFQKQALPWGAIAQFHIKQVTLVAKAFVDQLFRHVLGPPDASATTEAILRICVDRFFAEKERTLQSKMEELLRPYTRGYAMPLDSDFHRTRLERSRRQVTMAASKLINTQPEDVFTPWKEKAREAVSNLLMDEESPFGSEFGTEVVIDMMETYYEMSLRTFTDNIVNLAIEGCLVCYIPDILTPTKVDGMTNEELEELAAETDDAQSRRDHLQAEIEILREGLEQCRKYVKGSLSQYIIDPSTSRHPAVAIKGCEPCTVGGAFTSGGDGSSSKCQCQFTVQDRKSYAFWRTCNNNNWRVV